VNNRVFKSVPGGINCSFLSLSSAPASFALLNINTIDPPLITSSLVIRVE